MKGRAAGHRTHREDLQLDPFPVEIGDRFVPVDLAPDPPAVTLRNKRLVFGQPQEALAPLHILPDRPLRRSAARNLRADPIEDPSCRVTLLPRSLPVQLAALRRCL